MGHERVGYLPKTQKWTRIVEKMQSFSSTENDNTADIAKETTKNVRSRFKVIEEDGGVVSAFKYLVLLTYASKTQDPEKFLKGKGISLSGSFNVFELANSLQQYINKHENSKEYSAFAIQSMNDAISNWYQRNKVQQTSIFDSNINAFDTWKKAATGSGFCELARSFFASFTSRYLKYFLEREASSRIQSLYDRQQFVKNIDSHIGEISEHAFETAKITQSFAAGWYNNNAVEQVPSDKSIQGFLSFAFQKMNSEILREQHRE